MKKVEAIPVCPDCNCVMFRKEVTWEVTLFGWSCPECHITQWDKV